MNRHWRRHWPPWPTGKSLPLRGVGGYHLLCDADSEAAVARLRLRKGRPGKPLAVMLPWRGEDGLDHARVVRDPVGGGGCGALQRCAPHRHGTAQGRSTARALRRTRSVRGGADAGLQSAATICCWTASARPSSPRRGNLSGEPVLTEPEQARERLAAVADGFLHHNRPIVRPADDPVVRVIAGTVRPLRLGRGTAPLELGLREPVPLPLLAVGAYQKTTVALAWGRRVVVSPHIGDLASPPRTRSIRAGRPRSATAVRRTRRMHCARCPFGISQFALGPRLGSAEPCRLAPLRTRRGGRGRVPQRGAAAVLHVGRHRSRP